MLRSGIRRSTNCLILDAADKILPKRKRKVSQDRGISIRTKRLMAKRSKMIKRNSSRTKYKKIQRKIKESCIRDYVDWVDSCVSEMEETNKYGDVRKMYNLVNKISKKPNPPPSNLTRDKEGKLLQSPQEIVKRWEQFLESKFQAVEAEASM